MSNGDNFLTDRLAPLRASGNLRELPGTRKGIDFWSNDYLGLSGLLPTRVRSFATAPGSRLISGDHDRLSLLESEIAAFHGFDAALLFGSGYVANTGLLSCIARRNDTIIYDEFIHASTRDGIRLSGAAARRCAHNSLAQARSLLTRADRQNGEIFFLTEARFSMNGDTAPLTELAELCREFTAHFIVDEAHSIGIDGPAGAGLIAEFGLQDSVFASVVTYGKAMGCSGAAVLGTQDLREYLVNFSRAFIFTTAPRPEQVYGIENSYALLKDTRLGAVKDLRQLIKHFHESVSQLDLDQAVSLNDGPIQLIPVAGSAKVMNIERALLEDGILVKGIRAPSVPAGQERLRICLHAFNTMEEVDFLCQRLARHLTPKFA